MADTLNRQLGLGLLTAYGVGIMVRAGIHVLFGVAAGGSSKAEISLRQNWLTLIASALTLVVALLAKITTMALLVVFAIVSAALFGLKRRSATSPFSVPVFIPWFGLFACMGAFAAAIGGRL